MGSTTSFQYSHRIFNGVFQRSRLTDRWPSQRRCSTSYIGVQLSTSSSASSACCWWQRPPSWDHRERRQLHGRAGRSGSNSHSRNAVVLAPDSVVPARTAPAASKDLVAMVLATPATVTQPASRPTTAALTCNSLATSVSHRAPSFSS